MKRLVVGDIIHSRNLTCTQGDIIPHAKKDEKLLGQAFARWRKRHGESIDHR